MTDTIKRGGYEWEVVNKASIASDHFVVFFHEVNGKYRITFSVANPLYMELSINGFELDEDKIKVFYENQIEPYLNQMSNENLTNFVKQFKVGDPEIDGLKNILK